MLLEIFFLSSTIGIAVASFRVLVKSLLDDPYVQSKYYRYRIIKREIYKGTNLTETTYILQRKFVCLPIYENLYGNESLNWVLNKKIELERKDKESAKAKTIIRHKKLDRNDYVNLL